MKINEKAIETVEAIKDIILNPERHLDQLNEAGYNLLISRFKLSPIDVYDVIDGIFTYAISKDIKDFPATNPIYDIVKTLIKYYLDNPYKKIDIITFAHDLLDENSVFLKNYRDKKFYSMIFSDYLQGAAAIINFEFKVKKLLSLNIYEIPVLDTLINYKNFLKLCNLTEYIEEMLKIGYKFKFKSVEDINDIKLNKIPANSKKIKEIEEIKKSEILDIEIVYEKFSEDENILNYYYENTSSIKEILHFFENNNLIDLEKKYVYTFYPDIKKINFSIKQIYEFSNIIKIFNENDLKGIFIKLLFELNQNKKHISYEEILKNGNNIYKLCETIKDNKININHLIRNIIKTSEKNLITLFDLKYELNKFIANKKEEKISVPKKCFIKKIFNSSSNSVMNNIFINLSILKSVKIILIIKNIFDTIFYYIPELYSLFRKNLFLKKALYQLLLFINFLTQKYYKNGEYNN